jgi:hypothetical protein
VSLYVRSGANIPPTISPFAFIHIKASNLIYSANYIYASFNSQTVLSQLIMKPPQTIMIYWLIDRSAVMFGLSGLHAALRDLILLHRVDFWKYSGIDADIGRD